MKSYAKQMCTFWLYIDDLLKLWWRAPEGDLLSLARQVKPPFLTAHCTGVYCIFTLVLPCETFAKSLDGQPILAYPTVLRYHRAICLGRRDDQIRRITQASNVKKPTCFIVKSWIVRSDEGHDSAIWSICLFCTTMSRGKIGVHNIFVNPYLRW